MIIGTALTLGAGTLPETELNQSPTANAGQDKTIYLTETSTVTLNGSSTSGVSFLWSDISSDFKGGTISNPTSLITTVNGLKQGTFYYQLAVTSGGITVKDTVIIRVEYDVPTANSVLIRNFNMSDPKNYKTINNRADTSNYFDLSNRSYSQTADEDYYLFRARANGLAIDSCRGKLLSTNEDGYAGTRACSTCPYYPRSEIQISNMNWIVDTLHTYVFEWKGYFPQAENYLNKDNHPEWATILTMFQIHGNAYDYAIANFSLNHNGNITFNNTVVDNNLKGYGDFQPKDSLTIGFIPDFYNKSRTLRVTLKEGKGYPGQDAFIKMEIDGVTKYYRNTGGVGSPSFDDYVKFGGLYDWNSWITSKDSLARGRKYSLVTESFKIYTLPDNQSPVAKAGTDKTITLPVNTTSLAGSGTDADGQISGFLWTKIAGPTSYSITSATSATTNVTGLVQGIYQFELKVTDNSGATAKDTVMITVNAAQNIAPKANAGSAKTITLPVNTTSLAGSGTDADGQISGFLWTKIAGPSAYKIVNATSPVTDVTGLTEGIYQFELKVTDNSGATAKDTMMITVNLSNVPPVANAGSDITTTAPVSSITIIGSGSDVDGKISGYSWKQISGPSAININNEDSAIIIATGFVAGTYQFELTVSDDKGLVGKDTMTVTVALGRFAAELNSVNIYPNPVENIAYLEVNTKTPKSNLQVTIMDLNGKVVLTKKISSVDYFVKQEINMSNLVKGIYTLTVNYSNKDKQTLKVIKL
jgi:hypothetical protein